MYKFLIIVFFLFLFSCESKNNEVAIRNSHLVKINNAPRMYAVEFVALNFAEVDFNLNTYGNPYPVVFRLYENGELIWRIKLGALRGHHEFKFNDATAILSYNPESTYRIVIKDDGIITYPNTWGGGDWDKGMWPFNYLQDNKLYKGSSWVEVRCYPLPDMKYKSNLVFFN